MVETGFELSGTVPRGSDTGYVQGMDDDEFRYISWSWQAPMLLLVGLLGFALFGWCLVLAISHGSVLGMLGWGALTFLSVNNAVMGARLLRRRRRP